MKILDNQGNNYQGQILDNVITIRCNQIPEGLEYIDIIDESLSAVQGDVGYYVIADTDAKGSSLCYFNEKDDGERSYKQNLLPFFGVKKADKCVMWIAEGYKFEFHLVFGVKDGKYYIHPRFMLKDLQPYEDISMRIVEFSNDSTYSDMAVYYRNYQLENDACTPLAEKMKEREAVAYSVTSPEIRIRMGWKPAPSPVLEQTIETEPEMKVACTFDRVRDLIDELKLQGVDKAQICLVGWNKSGHDGRWPQIFPVEEKLGGEEKLRSLINHAQENGYQIVCHTNSTECYSIADKFSEDIVLKDQAENLTYTEIAWSGGRAYNLCPVKAYEYAKSELPKVRDLGFSGLHYIDVMSVIPLRWCFDKKHPLNPSETLEIYNDIMKLSHDLFGGFASEGSFDFCAKYLDYGLYVSWPTVENNMVDSSIPLWPIVYHGIILYNPTTDTVNYPIKDKKRELEVVEFGAIPAFYIYSKFLEGSNQDDWLGKEDLEIGTDEDIKFTVSKIKEVYEKYKQVMDLQTVFIKEHRKISESCSEIEYENGTVIKIDYSKNEYTIENQ